MPPSVPSDASELDPFFRSSARAGAIRQAQPPWQIRRWPEYFRVYGCLICEFKEQYGGVGLCGRCYMRTKKRLKSIEEDLRDEAEAMRG